MRDLSVELERDNPEASDNDKRFVQAFAWMGFPRPDEVEETLDAFGLSRGNKKNVEAYMFFPASRPYISQPFKMQGPIDYSGRPLHQQANPARKEYGSRENG